MSSIAVVSGKGGVGKSFFSVNIAAAFFKLGIPTLVIDTDSGMRSVDILLKKSDSLIFDLSDVALGNCELEKVITPVSKNGSFSIIAGAKDPDFIPSPDLLKSISAKLKKSFPIIIYDAPAGAGATVKNAVKAADRVILVTNPPKDSALTAAAVAQTVFNLCPEKKLHFVLNKVDPKGITQNEMSPDEIMDACVARFLGLIYTSKEEEVCRKNGKLLAFSDVREAKQLENIAKRICGQNVPLLY